MPKGKGKGGKSRRRGKRTITTIPRELILKEEGQEYAQITKMLNNGKVEAFCYDGITRTCHMPGKFRKKVWINKDDLILIALRDFQHDKADVIHKYLPDEVLRIKQILEISQSRPLVFGFIREEQELLPFQENVFYTIPDLVAHKCLEIYISLFFDKTGLKKYNNDDNCDDETVFSFDEL